jgi:hypothetical protein
MVSVDGTRVGTTPLPTPLWLAPGTHQIGVGRYDLVPAVQRIEVVPGREATISFQLHVAETKPPVVVPAPPAPMPAAAPAAPAPAPELSPPAVSSPTLLVAEPAPQGAPVDASHEGEASWPSLARNWRFWVAVGGAVVVTAIIFGIANSGGGGNTPTTTLGSQTASFQ